MSVFKKDVFLSISSNSESEAFVCDIATASDFLVANIYLVFELIIF
jgi:hypothetical protein